MTTLTHTASAASAAPSTPARPLYRFLSMAIATCNTIGNSVATVVVAKWSRTFDPRVAQRHLYPERYPQTAQADAALADGNLLPEDMNDANAHPTGIAMARAH